MKIQISFNLYLVSKPRMHCDDSHVTKSHRYKYKNKIILSNIYKFGILSNIGIKLFWLTNSELLWPMLMTPRLDFLSWINNVRYCFLGQAGWLHSLSSPNIKYLLHAGDCPITEYIEKAFLPGANIQAGRQSSKEMILFRCHEFKMPYACWKEKH